MEQDTTITVFRNIDAYILKVNSDGLKTSESFIPLSLHTINIYPNPSNGWVHFDYKGAFKKCSDSCRLMQKAVLVHQTQITEGVLPALDLSFLENGVYFIQVLGTKSVILCESMG